MAFDVVVAGGGPGGSVCAARLAALGRSVLVLEKDRHPRFHLGESLLPNGLPVLDAIGVLGQVRERFMVKRGARFVDAHDSTREVRYDFADAFHMKWDHAFQVPRDEFDELLFRRAGACGAELREGWEVTRVVFEGERAVGVEARDPEGKTHAIPARFVVDASGRDALLAHTTKDTERIAYLDRTAFYCQVRGGWRDVGERAGDIQIVVLADPAEPLSMRKPRGWFWHIPFADGRTSVGAVVSNAWIRDHKEAGGPPGYFEAALKEAPVVAEMLSGATRLFEPRAATDFSFRVKRAWGPGWAAVGDSSGFIDPLFSTGAHMAMNGGLRGADAIHASLDASGPVDEVFARWEKDVRSGSDLFLGAVQAFYEGDLAAYIFEKPQHVYLRRAITSMLAGDVFDEEVPWARDMKTRFPPMQ